MEQVNMVEVIPFLFRSGRKEKTHAAPYGFQEAPAWVSRGSWSEFPPNQRNVTEGSPASAAAVVSQQGRQASPAPAWLVNIFIAMCKLNPPLPKSQEAAVEMFNDALQYRNRYGLLAEDVHLKTGEACGNFPQTYSMAGLILTAMRLSRSWEDRYWHG